MATSPGPAPTALSSPTRRTWPAIRPPASTATLATASKLSSQEPMSKTTCSFDTTRASADAMSGHGTRNGADQAVCVLS